MNIKTPLAAALLMTASAAVAQTLLGASAETDMVEKCSTVPYRLCTTEELNFREIRKSGSCAPKDFACQRKQMENTGSAPLQLLGNQSNPSTANDDFFKKCGTIPYRLCSPEEQKLQDKWQASKKPDASSNKKEDGSTTVDEIVVTGRRYDQEPGFIGPPAPPNPTSYAPAMTNAQFQAGFQAVKTEFPNAIDLGNQRYGIPKNDGTIQVCGQGGCEDRPQSEFADQIQQANAESRNFTGSSGGGMSMTSTPSQTNPSAGARGTGSAGEDTQTPAPSEKGAGGNPAREQGADFFANQESIGGGSESGSGGGQGDVAMGGKQEVIKVDGAVASAEAAKTGYTYTRIGDAARNSQRLIDGGAASFSPAPVANGRLAEPPVGDGSHLGKIQSAANQ